MSEEERSLKEAITQYETQLSQIQFAITASSPGTDLDNLISLKDDIEELINLTRQNLASICSPNKAPIPVPLPDAEDEDPFAKEYALFKAELASSEPSNTVEDDELDSSAALADIHSDLNELKGMKCQAPHSHQWGGSESYHNALVCSIEPSEDVTNVDQIKIRVMFTNPTHQEMLPCPYFLEGECRFDDDQCRFSHGEVVNLSSLKEYREPDFSVIRIGARVLVKNKDKLWHRAIVSALHADSRCEVKLEASRGAIEVDLHDLLPMIAETDGTDSQSNSSCDELSEDEDDIKALLVEQSLLATPLSSALGSWEEHTKGIGSRLMAQMGYVTGAGLGKYGDGRIEPIEAVVLPAGKSLDHCMALREQAGGDKNLFKVERRMRRIQRKQKINREKKFANEKRNARTDVFDFINITLSGKQGKEPESSPCSTKSGGKIGSAGGSTSLKTETQRELNVVGFQVGEDIRRAESDLVKLRQSLSRHSQGSAVHKTVAAKLNEKESELSQLRANERSIDEERSQRTDRKKLSVF